MRRTLTALTAPLLLGLTASLHAGDHAESSPPQEHIAAIETAHERDAYYAQSAVQADMLLNFGPMKLDATLTFTPSNSHTKMEIKDVGTMVYDGKQVWVTPADAAIPGPPARFHALTWPYFVAAPYKLSDPGTYHSSVGKHAVTNADDQRVGTKVTFGEGVGDAPDDWYIAFSDDQNRLDALAYIVTASKSREEAEKSPSIILYSDFVEVDGVPFATTWDFHFWNATDGVGDPKGTAKLSNIKFVQVTDDTFAKPDNAIESKMP